jgi:hypothetical protein
MWSYVTLLGGAVTPASSNHKMRWSKSKLRHGSIVSLPTGIVNLMSSSLSSLAVRCLTRGELTKAKQVTKVSMCMLLMFFKNLFVLGIFWTSENDNGGVLNQN